MKAARSLALFVAIGAHVVACSRDTSSTTVAPLAPSAAQGIDGGQTLVHVDASLLAKGRVATSAVGGAGDGTIVAAAGEIAPGPEGDAEVGALVVGRVARLLVAEGDRVAKNQVVAEIESQDIGRASADATRARARLDLAQKHLARQSELAAENATSGSALDEAKAEVASAKADVAASEALLRAIGAGLASTGRLALRAPIAGVVVKREAAQGSPVRPDSSLLRIVAPDKLVVRAKLPETSEAPPIGARATVRSRARAGATCEAVVTSAFGVIDDATRTMPIVLRPDACAWLVPGAYVDVSIRLAAGADAGAVPDGIVVPEGAVVDVRGAPIVFVARGEADFEPRHVRVGRVEAGLAHVEAGLATGDRVVTTGALLLKGELLRGELGGD